ncbi:MAG: oligosaccharide flippase family protein, partial [Chloroflexota bacterium]
YGIWGVSLSVGQFLSLLLPFGMLMAVGRFYFDAKDDSERAESLGTIFVFLAVVPLIILLLLQRFGAPLFALVTPDVPYDPYLRLTAWASYFSMFSIIPLMVLRSREQAGAYLLFNLGQAMLFHGLAIGLVVFGGQGVTGMLWANLAAAFVFAFAYIFQTVRWFPPRLSLTRLAILFRYSLPLVVHGLAGWILMLSDRLILARFVPLADVGVYSLGYTLGTIIQNAADAATSAWFPAFYASRADPERARQTAQVATYLLFGIALLALLLTLGLPLLFGWLLPESYRGAQSVVTWVALSGVFVQVYYILSYSIHYTKQTSYLAIISWGAALVNLVINFTLIPRYGFVVAAISTLAAYVVMAALVYFFANRLYRVDYEFKRWGILIAVTCAVCAGSLFRPSLPALADVALTLALFAGWLAALTLLGFFTARDKAFLREWLWGGMLALSTVEGVFRQTFEGTRMNGMASPRVAFGMIVLNGEPFLKYNLRALYPFAHQIVVVEGASPQAADSATEDGHSLDNTLSIVRNFIEKEDPERKVTLVTAEDEGHPNGFWPGDKDEQSQAYARRATGDWLWQVDVDEFYQPEDMQWVFDYLQAHPDTTCLAFDFLHFWGGFDTTVNGGVFMSDIFAGERAGAVRRVFRWGRGYRYVTHRPPTVQDEAGRSSDRVKVNISRKSRRVKTYHYFMVFPSQAIRKGQYYDRMGWKHEAQVEERYRRVFSRLSKEDRVL